jgi:hypothetical protein
MSPSVTGGLDAKVACPEFEERLDALVGCEDPDEDARRRPHEALRNETAASVFLARHQKRNTPKRFFYPDTGLTLTVEANGSLRFRGQQPLG